MIATIYSTRYSLLGIRIRIPNIHHWDIQRAQMKSITVTVPIFFMCFVCAHLRILVARAVCVWAETNEKRQRENNTHRTPYTTHKFYLYIGSFFGEWVCMSACARMSLYICMWSTDVYFTASVSLNDTR